MARSIYSIIIIVRFNYPSLAPSVVQLYSRAHPAGRILAFATVCRFPSDLFVSAEFATVDDCTLVLNTAESGMKIIPLVVCAVFGS